MFYFHIANGGHTVISQESVQYAMKLTSSDLLHRGGMFMQEREW
jgi:hypothetical protein